MAVSMCGWMSRWPGRCHGGGMTEEDDDQRQGTIVQILRITHENDRRVKDVNKNGSQKLDDDGGRWKTGRN